MAARDPERIIDLPDEAATRALAEDVAAILVAGDVVALSGGLGAGKTTFARALLRAFFNDDRLEVPSPTFTLVQTYSGRLPIAHFDFYRLESADELDEIGFEDAVSDGAVLVEWPERAGARLPQVRIDLGFEIAGAGRRVTVAATGSICDRFRRSRDIRSFLVRAGWIAAARRHLQGDASTRRYERIGDDGRKAVLMDWPPPKQKTARRRIPYRAEEVSAFIAVGNALRAAGLSAPEFYFADTDAGFLLMEDLGAEGIVADGAPIEDRYRATIAALANIHNRPRPADLPLRGGTLYRLPTYGSDAFAAELDEFADWYVPYATGNRLAGSDRESFKSLWTPLLARLAGGDRSWALLDVHSPNLLWLPERQGTARVGFLDFQDAMIGPCAYDVASLAQDARVTVPPDVERRLVDDYVALRQAADPDFDAEVFHDIYAIVAAQRATRILGVFARLAERDGKPGYLRHIPRVSGYLARALVHPVLSAVAVWYEEHRLL